MENYKFNAVRRCLTEMCDDDLMAVFNRKKELEVSSEEEIHIMDDLDDVCNGMTALQILNSLDDDFKPSDGYFYWDERTGLYVSVDNVEDAVCAIDCDFDDLANYVVRDSAEFENMPQMRTFLSDLSEEFTAWAEDKGEDGDWLIDADEAEILSRNWLEYLSELKEEYADEAE